jgi:lipopolysaccharide export system permease protein
MKIIDKYVLKEFLVPFFFGVTIFLTIFLVDMLMELIELVIVRGVPVNMVLQLLIFTIPKFYVLVCPMSLLFSSLLTVGKMSTDNEIIAFKSGGVSFPRIVISIFLVGFIFTVLNILITEYVVPESNIQRKKIARKISFAKPLPKIAEKVFFEAGTERIFYIGEYVQETGKMKDVYMYEFPRGNEEYPKIIQSKTAIWKDSIWTFEDGVVKDFYRDGLDNMVLEFKKYSLPIKLTYNSYDDNIYKDPKDMSIKELMEKIKDYKKKNISTDDLYLELYSKFSFPFASLVFVLIGAPLALRPSRSGNSIGMGLSIVIIFLYYILLALGKALGQSNIITPFLSVWLPNLVIGIVGIILIIKARK